jgi:tetratricopeptide (TPR) repeat protein
MIYYAVMRPLSFLLLGVVACSPRPDAKKTATTSGGSGASTLVPITTTSAEARQHYLAGLDLFDKVRFADARGHFELAAAKDSTFALAHYYLAVDAATPQSFFHHLSRAVALESKASDGERLLIQALEAAATGQPAQQVRYLEQLVTAYPNDPRSHFLLGFAHLGQQAYDQSIADFTSATALDSTFSPAYNGLGYAYRPLGRYDDAERAFQRYIALIPNEPNPYDSYAELLLKMGRYPASIQNYKKALALDPHFNSSHVGIAADLMYQGKNAAALAEVQKLSKNARDDGERRVALINMAIVELDGGRADRAIQHLRASYAVAKRGKDVPAMANDAILIGNVQLEARRPDQAAKQYQEALRMTEASNVPAAAKADARIENRALLARVALKRGNLAVARREAKAYADSAARGVHPEKVRQGHELMGLIALAAHDYAGALTHLGQADQHDPYVLYAVARAYEGKRDRAKAREMYARVANFNELPTLRFAAVRSAAKKKAKTA